MRGVLVACLCIASLLGCPESGTTVAQSVSSPGTIENGPSCDAGGEAFVRRAITHMWGRHPHSIHEVELLMQVAQTYDRATLIRQMTHSDEYRERWSQTIRDLYFVNRIGERDHKGCGTWPQLEDVTATLAAHIRDTPPDGPPFPVEWTLVDALESALVLDDLSPYLRVQLINHTLSRLIDADNLDDELAWRKVYSDLFERTFLNRRMECLSCHNSESSVTGSPDPALDRTWEVPGHFEKALYGQSQGRPVKDLVSFFRLLGVLSWEFRPQEAPYWFYADGVQPWGMMASCGQLVPRAEIEDDTLGGDGWFGGSVGAKASIWDLETMLHQGFDQLRSEGLQVDEQLQVQGESALAWLTAMNLVDMVWENITGFRLTVPHSFPRNRYQRDLLQHLTQTFVAKGFSLRELLAAILTHPYINQNASAGCPDLPSPYYMSALFNPWAVDDSVADHRGNSLGDLVIRRPPRMLLRSTARALGWDLREQLSGTNTVDNALYDFMIDIGIFLMDGERGFRGHNLWESLAWEDVLAQCSNPFPSDPSVLGGDTRAEEEGEANTGGDWIVRILQNADAEHTLEDAVIALKDRLLAAPVLQHETERALIEALLAHPLSTPLQTVSDAEPALRRICGALLSSPDFLLQGLPPQNYSGAAPKLIVPDGSRATFCAQIASELFPDGSATCDAQQNLSFF